MSEALVLQWNDRVVEAESELQVIRDELAALVRSSESSKAKKEGMQQQIQREKQSVLKQLEIAEKRSGDCERAFQDAEAHKQKVEMSYRATLDEYGKLHTTVKDIKSQEEALHNRKDYERDLQQATLAWADEEHVLRRRVQQLDSQVKALRKQQQDELSAVDAMVKEEERLLQQQRQLQAAQHVTDDLSVPQQPARSYHNGVRQDTSTSKARGSSRRETLGELTNT